MRTKVSRNQLIRRLVNLPTCLVGLEAGAGSHHIAHQIQLLGHDVRLIPAQYVQERLPRRRGDRRGSAAPTMNFVAIKTPEQSDLLSLHRVRSRLVWPGLGCAWRWNTPSAWGAPGALRRRRECARARSLSSATTATGVPSRRQNDASTRGVVLIPSASPSAMPPTSGAPAVPMTPRPPTHLDERREFREAKDPHFVCPPYH